MSSKKSKKEQRRSQTTLEYIIIVAVVAIAAILASVAYMKSTSGSTIGSSTEMIGVGVNTSSNAITVAFSKALPSSAGTFTLNGKSLTGTPTPNYVDNYPEYTFSSNAITSGTSVTSFGYDVGTSAISVLPATPNMTVQSIVGNVVQPS